MKVGGKGFLLFAKAQSETPGRLTAHAYSYEAKEWAGYEMLIRFAETAGDAGIQRLCETLLVDERTMVVRLAETFDSAAGATLAAVAGG